MRHKHRWSGWPGAYCLKCGTTDPMEYAIGMNWYNPHTSKWDTEEHRLDYVKRSICPVSDEELIVEDLSNRLANTEENINRINTSIDTINKRIDYIIRRLCRKKI